MMADHLRDAIKEIHFINDDATLLSKFTPSHLHNFVTACDLAHPLSRTDRLLLLNAIKLLAKHPALNSFLYDAQDFRIMATIAGLSDPQGFTENDELANEARKIIANLLLLDQKHGVHILVSQQCLPALLELSASSTTSLQSIFLIYRILFLITALPDHISTIISFGLTHYDSLLIRVLNDTTDPLKSMALSEILKTMFNLQSRSGAEFDKPTNIFSQKVMHTVSQTLTTIPIPFPHPMTSPHADAVHVLMCGLPGPWLTDRLVNILCNDMLLPECLNNLFPITLNGHEKRDKVVPLLYLLAQLYTNANQPALADLIRSFLVPSDLDRVRPLDQGRTLGHFLIRMLTYIESSAIRVAAETLVFSLFDKSPSKMVAHTGLGPSAGFLANHGLLNSDMLGADGPTNSNVNPITGQSNSTQSTTDDEWIRMTDEEKEREAEQLFAKFDRLNDLGIIKVQDPRSLS